MNLCEPKLLLLLRHCFLTIGLFYLSLHKILFETMRKILLFVHLLVAGVLCAQETTNLTVTLEFGSNVDAGKVSVSIPTLKYNKEALFSYTADDAPSNAYGRAFMAINKKWVDDAGNFHIGMERTTGYTPEKTLGYTDGCGVERRMNIGVAVWPTNGTKWHPLFMDRITEGKGYNYMLWQELMPILDFGGSAYFHDVNDNKDDPDRWDPGVKDDILKGFAQDQEKTYLKTGRRMKVLMRPSNNNTYIEAANEYDDIVMSWAEGSPSKPLDPFGDQDFLKKVGTRYMYRDNPDYVMQWLTEGFFPEDPSKRTWRHLFTHGVTPEFVELLTKINDTWGKDGTDALWMATVDEAYEYFYMRKNAVISKTVSGKKVTISLKVPTGRNFYFQDLSLLVDGVPAPTKVTVSDNANTLSWNHKEGQALVNLGFNPLTVARAEKYTRKYEISGETEDKEDALYFINQLKPQLQTAFLNRVNKGQRVTPIVLQNVALNRGMEYSFYADAYFEFDASEEVTHYKAGETVDLSTQAWKPLEGKKAWFTLAKALGRKVAYVQVKNATNESPIYAGALSLRETINMPADGVAFVTSIAPTLTTDELVEYRTHEGRVANLLKDAHKTSEVTIRSTLGEELGIYYHTTKLPGNPGRKTTGEFPVIATNETGYPDEWISNCLNYMESRTPEVITPHRLLFMVPNGEYQVRIFGSSKNKASSHIENLFYEVNGVVQSPTFSMQNNGRNYMMFNNVVVDNSYIVIKYWSNPATGNMAPINLVEFRSKSFLTGMGQPAAEKKNLNVKTEKGKVILSAEKQKFVAIYTAEGLFMGNYRVNEVPTEVTLPGGIYIIDDAKVLVP